MDGVLFYRIQQDNISNDLVMSRQKQNQASRQSKLNLRRDVCTYLELSCAMKNI
uniref:Uncharacterized protein n=1 Tax=Meloidogyne enterolobii TaxID=390850 RepID=A0A6V7UJD6_MELEN|nr:unnamed protein product [Meloidogyne enterolobii]